MKVKNLLNLVKGKAQAFLTSEKLYYFMEKVSNKIYELTKRNKNDKSRL